MEKVQLVSINTNLNHCLSSFCIFIDSQIRNLTADLEQAREQLDEEQEAKSELQKQVTKINAEVQQWRARYESEG